jgi:hypothetical protein
VHERFIETCIAAFCYECAMFESNFPVDKGSCGYAALWNGFKRITAGCSAIDNTALFAGSATKFYRLRRCVPDRCGDCAMPLVPLSFGPAVPPAGKGIPPKRRDVTRLA